MPVTNYDPARAQQLYARAIPNPPPASMIVIVGAGWCEDTHQSMVNTNYATQTADGIPIYWVDDAQAAGHQIVSGIPNAPQVLGRGIGPELASRDRSNRAYNYPTAVAVQDGQMIGVIHGDTIPANGFTRAGMEAGAEAYRRPRPWDGLPQLEARLSAQGELPASPAANHLYMVVDRNCGHCRELLTRSNFAAQTEAGVPITYVDLGTQQGQQFRAQHLQLVQGWPALVETNAQGVPSLSAIGVPEILSERFPRIAQASPATPGQRPTEAAEDLGGATPDTAAAARPAATESAATANTNRYASRRGEFSPPVGSLQEQLMHIGFAMSDGKADPAIVAAVEQFYRSTSTDGAAMASLGTLSETEMTAVLNRLQLAAHRPDLQDELRTLGTALGVNVTTLPAAAAAQPRTAVSPGTEIGAGETPEGNRDLPERIVTERDASAGLRA